MFEVLPFLIIVLAFVAAGLLTGILRRYALASGLLDIPNSRSSHSVPTPRGGGMAIVLTVLAGSFCLWWLGALTAAMLWVTFGAGGLVALVGWLDDRGHVATCWRLLTHFMAAGSALVILGGLPPMPFFGTIMDLSWLGHGLAAVYLVWLLNLFNFMDGIDGIASIEAITVCLGGVALYLFSSSHNSEWTLPLLLAAAVSGFLSWNFPKAKIFMGDAGSGFIGMVLGLLSIQAANVAPKLLWGWVILLGVFVVDATVTLLRRMLRRQRLHEAHRNHAYQYAARKYNSHVVVSLVVGGVNVFWLLPLAVLVALGWLDGFLGMLISYLPLVGLSIWYKSGVDSNSF